MNDNIANITTLINNQIVMMNTYNNNVIQSMQYISNSIRELIHLQEGRDMEERIIRRRRNNIPISSTSNFIDNNINRINQNISRLNRDIQTLDSRDNNTRVRLNRNINRNANVNTTQPFIFSTSRLPTTSRSRPRRPLRNRTQQQPYMNPLFNRRRRRRMTLQEFINSTLGQGNPRIPADRNQIMQQTSIVDFQDLSGTDIHTCPISLTTFDASSNILRINACNHIFQADSLMRWFQEDSRCPVCRYNINRDLSNQTVPRISRDRNTTRSTNTQQESNTNHEDNNENINNENINNENINNENINDENNESNISPNTIVYDISFSIPQLFGRDMSENQINEVIESITNTITNSMNNTLSNYNDTIEDGDVVVEEMIIERVDDNNTTYGDMESDSDEN